MSGETEKDISGWTTDTLHSLLVRLLAEHDRRYQDRFEEQEQAVRDALAAASAATQHAFEAQEKAADKAETLVTGLISERDLRYQQRFDAQEQALQAALTAAENAVTAALAAAEKAVNKAEVANEKRFESVNEFRAQLADQARTFAPREFVESQLGTIAARLDDANAARSEALREAAASLSGMLPREVYETAHQALVRKTDDNSARIITLEGDSKATQLWTTAEISRHTGDLLPRGVYEAALAASMADRAALADRLSLTEGEIKAARRASAAYATAVGVGVTILTIGLSVLTMLSR